MPELWGRASPSEPVGLDDVSVDVNASYNAPYPRMALPPLNHVPGEGADPRGLALLLHDQPAKGAILPHIGTPPGGRRPRKAQDYQPMGHGRRDKPEKVIGRQLKGKPVVKPVMDLVRNQRTSH
eukprot:913312-Pyramimonas_sp.AAC.1